MRITTLLALFLLLSCGTEPAANETASASFENRAESSAQPSQDQDSNDATGQAPLDPPAPGEPGGLPDDRTPVSEAPFTETSAQGAANVVQTYHALIEQGRYGDAWRFWAGGGESSGMSEQAFAASFAKYREYHAQIGAPGPIEGAAGSLYVEVPVHAYGRLKDGTPFNMRGPITLRRVNDVPGSTPEQRRWHIASSAVK